VGYGFTGYGFTRTQTKKFGKYPPVGGEKQAINNKRSNQIK